MKKNSKYLISILLLSFCQSLSGQNRIDLTNRECTQHTVSHGKYKVLSRSDGAELQFYLAIQPKFRTDQNYMATAKEFIEKYCDAARLRIIYLKNREQWLITDPHDVSGTPLAIFFSGNNATENEGIEIYSVSEGQVQSRQIKIND